MKLKLVLSPAMEAKAKAAAEKRQAMTRAKQPNGTANEAVYVYVTPGVKAQLNQMALSMQRSMSSVIAELLDAALEQLVTIEPDDPASIQRGRNLTPDEMRAEAEDDALIQRGQNPRNDGDIAAATNAQIRKTLRAAGVPDPHAVITPKPTREDYEWRRANPKTGDWHPDYDPVNHKWRR